MISRRLFYLQVFMTLIFGAFAACISVLSATYIYPHIDVTYPAISWGPWIEEGLKYTVIIFLIRVAYLRPVAIPFIGIGFGFTEGLSHILHWSEAGIKPLLAHLVFASVMAFFFYFGMKSKEKQAKNICYSLAYIIPVYLHLLFNFQALGLIF